MIALDKLMRFRALRCPFNLRFLYIRDVCSAAPRRYKLMPFLGRIDLFRAEHQAPTDLFEEDPLLGWGGMAAGGIEVHRLPGCHDQIFEKPGVAIFAHQLKACLAQAKGDLR
jgi:thioesterase domain-containing protein